MGEYGNNIGYNREISEDDFTSISIYIESY